LHLCQVVLTHLAHLAQQLSHPIGSIGLLFPGSHKLFWQLLLVSYMLISVVSFVFSPPMLDDSGTAGIEKI
jgi:hypothetical protein